MRKCWVKLAVAVCPIVVVGAFQQQSLSSSSTRGPFLLDQRPSMTTSPLVATPSCCRSSPFTTRIFQETSRSTSTAATGADTDTTTMTVETPLSDVDARVLESILREEKVDLKTEEDIRKLLERGTVKTTFTKDTKADDDDDQDSVFSSTVIKTLAETKLWKKVSLQASDWFETVTIWVANKVEQDVKVLAALGLFAWDRAVRDVARALPETSSSSSSTGSRLLLGGRQQQVMLLSNSSSFQAPPTTTTSNVRAIMEDMNKPSEEIREVTRSILKILSGETRRGIDLDSSRGLKTAAPAGTINSGERMRRAYRQYKTLDRQQRDVTRIPGAVIDTAFELKRELTAEASQPGYKTQNIRNAIGAGVAETSRMLSQVKEGARLAAAKKKALRLQAAQAAAAAKSSLRDDMVERLKLERSEIAKRLRYCIKEPENTWLREEVLLASDATIEFDQEALREVVMAMMLVRDEIEAKQEEQNASPSSSFEELLQDIKSIRSSLEDIRGRAATATTYGVAEALWDVVVGLGGYANDMNENDDSTQPLLLKLDEIERLVNDTNTVNDVSVDSEEILYDNAFDDDEEEDDVPVAASVFADVERPVATPADETTQRRSFTTVEILDVNPEPVMYTELNHPKDVVFDLENNKDDSYAFLETARAVEIVSDDDYDFKTGNIPRRVVEVSEELETEEDKDAMMLFTLRLLDIIFFVFEKTFTVAIPKSILIAETFSRRFMEVNQGGKGSTGWQQVRNAANPKGRY